MSFPTSESVQKDISSEADRSQELTPFTPSVNLLGFCFVHVVLDWEVSAAPSRENIRSRWGPVTVENRCIYTLDVDVVRLRGRAMIR